MEWGKFIFWVAVAVVGGVILAVILKPHETAKALAHWIEKCKAAYWWTYWRIRYRNVGALMIKRRFLRWLSEPKVYCKRCLATGKWEQARVKETNDDSGDYWCSDCKDRYDSKGNVDLEARRQHEMLFGDGDHWTRIS